MGRQIGKIGNPSIPTTGEVFGSHIVLARNVKVNGRLDVCATVQLIVPGLMLIEEEHFNLFQKEIDQIKETILVGNDFGRLRTDWVWVLISLDALFSSATGIKSRMGSVILILNRLGRENIVYQRSSRCYRRNVLVLAADVRALVYVFDHEYVNRMMHEKLMGQRNVVKRLVDSLTIFNIIAINNNTAK